MKKIRNPVNIFNVKMNATIEVTKYFYIFTIIKLCENIFVY